jgi:dihydroorotase
MSLRSGETITIPSPIDVHVHLREPGGEDKETIATGTEAAWAGGYQAVYDMPNNPNRPTWTEARLDEKIAIASQTDRTDIGFYAGVDLENPAFEEFPGMVRKAAGLKLYMGHTTGNTVEHDLDSARPAIDAWMGLARKLGKITPILLHAREKIGSETAEYVARQKYPVHWCHISTDSEVRQAEKLTRNYPEYYTGGVTPHHLTMTARNADFQQGWNGARMQPPLGKERDAERLLHAYNNGSLQILETDHAPHTKDDKHRAEAENPTGETDPNCVTCFGVSGIEFVLPVMTSLVRRNLTTMERVVDSLYDQPKRMLQLGSTAMQKQTKLAIGPWVIGENDIVGKSRNTPYVGWVGSARVVSIR